jgi:hypothetical protein
MGSNSGQSNDSGQHERRDVLFQLGNSRKSSSSACTIAGKSETASFHKEGVASRFGLKRAQSMLGMNTAGGGGGRKSSRRILMFKTAGSIERVQHAVSVECVEVRG